MAQAGFPRLVYSPKAYVYVKDSNGQIRDLSAYVSAGRVSRKISQISTAEITLRNPDMIFTDRKAGALLLPMDPITIYLQRLRARPVRVFTGFLDQTPWLQLYPGTVTLKASCTLKKLLYTFFDPALPYVQGFLQQYGWVPNGQGEIINPAEQSKTYKPGDDPRENPIPSDDGSIGNLLFATLKHIGNWDPSTIYIDKLPAQLPGRVAQLAREFQEDNAQAKKEFESLLSQIIGGGVYGAGGGDTSGGGSMNAMGSLTGAKSVVPVIVEAATKARIPAEMAVATCFLESSFDPNADNGNHIGYFQWDKSTGVPGSYQKCGVPANTYTLKDAQDIGKASEAYCRAAAGALKSNRNFKNNLRDWTLYVQGATCGDNPLYCSGAFEKAVTDAKSLITKYASSDLSSKAIGEAKKISGDLKGVTDAKIFAPISKQGSWGRGWHEDTKGHTGLTDTSGSVHWHSGIDYGVPAGTDCVAPTDGIITMAQAVWSDGGMVHFKFTKDTGQIKKGTVIGWGHVQGIRVKVGDHVKGGQVVALSGNPGGGPHVHFIYRPDGSDGGGDGSANPVPILQALQKGSTVPTPGGDTSTDGGGSGTDQMYTNEQSVAFASSFAAQLEWPTIEDTVEAIGLQGQKSLMNDKPLMPFIEQLTDASLRQFQSMPNGNFYAFYPDYFGEFGRKPYWMINDIEILDGGFDINDEALATHVYVVGDTIPGGIDQLDRLFSGGVVSIFNAFMAGKNIVDHTTSSGPEKFTQLIDKSDAIKFLQRYGARPQLFEEPMVRSPYFEAFLAYQKFMLLWSRQFLTTFTFTFMPELFPGGKVGIPDHGVQAYIEEVEHTWDYTSGFFTQANLTAPSTLAGTTSADLPPNMVTQQTLYEPIQQHETLVKSPLGGSFPVTPSPDALTR